MDVWLANRDTVRLHPDEYKSWLDDREMAQLERYANYPAGQRYLASHAALRQALGDVVDRHPADLVFRYNSWGRPELPNGPSFNLSHAGSWAAVVIDSDLDVGIDIEINTRRIIPQLAQVLLSRRDAQQEPHSCLDSLSLLRVWVRKEAVLKASGKGLAGEPRQLSVGLHPSNFRSSVTCFAGAGRQPFSYIDIDLPIAAQGCVARTNELKIRPPEVRWLTV